MTEEYLNQTRESVNFLSHIYSEDVKAVAMIHSHQADGNTEALIDWLNVVKLYTDELIEKLKDMNNDADLTKILEECPRGTNCDKSKVEKFDSHTFQPFDRVLAKDGVSSWVPTFFGFLIDPADDFYTDNEVAVCNDYAYKQVIPYNDETKHLVGTTDDCPEFYKWWEE